MTYKHSLIATSIASALLLSGCGSSDNKDDNPDVPPATSAFSGVVNKGILANAPITICAATSTDCSDDDAFRIETRTDEQGRYELKEAIAGTPLLVIARADAHTLMTCDIAQCAEGINFGDQFNPDAGFELKAVTPGISAHAEGAVVNVTSLTELAANQAISESGNSGIFANTIRRSNDIIRQTFNLGDNHINEIGAVDLTDPEQMAGASSEDQLAAVYSASVMQAQQDNPELELDELLSTTDGQTYTVDTDALEEIFNSARDVVEEVDEHHDDIEMGDIVDEIEDAEDNLGDLEDGIAPDPDLPEEDLDEVKAARAFVSDVRGVVKSVADGGDLNNALRYFAEQFEELGEFVGDDMGEIIYKVELGAMAIADAYLDGSHNNVEISGNTYTVVGIDSLEMVVAIDKDDIDESEACDDNVCTGEASADIDMSIQALNITENKTALSAQGRVLLDNVQIEYVDGYEDLDGGYIAISSEVLTADQLSFQLAEVELTHTDVSFTGNIGIDGSGVIVAFEDDYGYNWSGDNQGGYDFYNTEISLRGLSLGFDGELAKGNEFANIGLGIDIDNPDGFVYFEQVCHIWGDLIVDTDCEPSRTEESEEKYVRAGINAFTAVDVAHANNDNIPASIDLTVKRDAFSQIDGHVKVVHQDTTTNIRGAAGIYDRDGEIEPITATNVDGTVVMALEENDEGRITGTITVEGVHAADVDEDPSGLITIRYTDGSFESIL
ncbi:hypothetical protein [Ferrimonas pelagia]|uniref:Carboxypeptidase regulatory-like domain-containing protein n=1 Tax=Ferrimonas pelagia TaxID=1177826 RepID=A0ABP9EAM7_9GAMM